MTDEQAKDIIKLYSDCSNATEFQALFKVDQEKNIRVFRDKGLSIRQIVRLSGISKGLVEKVRKQPIREPSPVFTIRIVLEVCL